MSTPFYISNLRKKSRFVWLTHITCDKSKKYLISSEATGQVNIIHMRVVKRYRQLNAERNPGLQWFSFTMLYDWSRKKCHLSDHSRLVYLSFHALFALNFNFPWFLVMFILAMLCEFLT